MDLDAIWIQEDANHHGHEGLTKEHDTNSFVTFVVKLLLHQLTFGKHVVNGCGV